MSIHHEHISSEGFSALLGQRLKALRVERNMSQEAVAQRAGVSTYTYQKFEKGESKPGTPMNPRLFTLLALADTYGMDVRDLLTFDGSARGAAPTQESENR